MKLWSRKKRLFVILGILGIVYGYLAIRVYLDATPDDKAPDKSKPKKYINLFSDSCLKKLDLLMSNSNVLRDTVSYFDFVDYSYRIVVCKLKDTSIISMDKYITEENKSSYWQESGVTYSGCNVGDFRFEYLPRELAQNKNGIIFRYCCDSLQCCIKGKDRVYYSGLVSSTSICKGESSNEDMLFFTGGSSFQLSVMLLYRDKSLFYIAMTPRGMQYKMAPKLLWRCIK